MKLSGRGRPIVPGLAPEPVPAAFASVAGLPGRQTEEEETTAEERMMGDPQTVFDQVNVIVKDMDAALAFYSRLGLRMPQAPVWPPGSGARHAEITMPSGVRLEFDNHEMVAIWHPGWAPRDGSPRAVLGFSLPSREAVDARYAELTAAGYAGRQPPHDAFWGARYAIVQDPDGNEVGLMSPKDPQKQFTPAA